MSLFDKLKNSVHQTYVKGAEKIIPTLKESKFLEEGVLTPEEVSFFCRHEKIWFFPEIY
jgi:hypothetical protein